MAKMRVAMVLSALLFAPIGTAGAAPANGDFNGDSKVTVADVVGALRATVGITTPEPAAIARADITQDGRLDIRDVVRILRIVAGLDPGAPSWVAAIPYSIYDSAQPDLVSLFVGAVPGATGYRLYLSDDGSTFFPVQASFDTTSSRVVYALMSLPTTRSTSFRVAALKGATEGPQSDTIVCKPQVAMGSLAITAPTTGAVTTPTVTWVPKAGATKYLVELRQSTRPIRIYAVTTTDPAAGVTYDDAHSSASLVPYTGRLLSGMAYWAFVMAFDSENWCVAYGSKRFTTAPLDPSVPAGPFTGRWLALMPGPGALAGGLGLLLEEWGGEIHGSLGGFPLYDIVRDGDTLSGKGSTGDYQIDWQLKFSGDRSSATGAFSYPGAAPAASVGLSLARQSTSATLPTILFPDVTATVPANGATGVSRHLTQLQVTWSRPVLGGELRVLGTMGGLPIDVEGVDVLSAMAFDPATNTFTLMLKPGTVLDANARYQVILSLRDNVSWFDAYGVAPWLTPSKAYSFSFTTGAE
ncbi:MAG TPA: dockerin type I domain-containing protein [Armatimonadota bacterium]|jgi:hypothetical protein